MSLRNGMLSTSLKLQLTMVRLSMEVEEVKSKHVGRCNVHGYKDDVGWSDRLFNTYPRYTQRAIRRSHQHWISHPRLTRPTPRPDDVPLKHTLSWSLLVYSTPRRGVSRRSCGRSTIPGVFAVFFGGFNGWYLNSEDNHVNRVVLPHALLYSIFERFYARIATRCSCPTCADDHLLKLFQRSFRIVEIGRTLYGRLVGDLDLVMGKVKADCMSPIAIELASIPQRRPTLMSL